MFPRLIGDIHPPAEASSCFVHCFLINLDVKTNFTLNSYASRPFPIALEPTLLYLLFIIQIEQPFQPVLLDDHFGSLAQQFDISKMCPARFALIQNLQSSLSILHSGLQSRFGHLCLLQRTNDQPPLYPVDRLSIHHSAQRLRPFISFGNLLRLAILFLPVNRGQRLLSRPDRIQIGFQLGIRQLHCRQRTEVEIPTRLRKGTRPNRRHFAIANIEQSLLLHPLPHLSNSGNIQWVIGTLSRQNLGCHWHPQWVQGRKHHLHLWQVWPMIFTVPKLKQPLFCYPPVAASRGAVQTHPLRVQIVHPQQVLVQCRLKLSPALIIAQCQHNTFQAVVAEVQGTHRLTDTTFQCLQTLLSPVLNLIEPVITLRKDVSQPDRTRPTQANPPPVAMRRKVFIQRGLNTHPFHLRQQNRNVFHQFVCYGKILVHNTQILPHFPAFVKLRANRGF
ncbi:MAG: hypothetical protein DDT27_01449 [Dehalococcoidia bacterium]|nr:hypothetical protein [Chloroflexota bacterium]